jgi:hypothetical protein
MTALYWRLGEKFARERPVRLSWDRGSFALFQAHDDLVPVKTVVSRPSTEQISSNYLKIRIHHNRDQASSLNDFGEESTIQPIGRAGGVVPARYEPLLSRLRLNSCLPASVRPFPRDAIR